jgi:hypothetical protein
MVNLPLHYPVYAGKIDRCHRPEPTTADSCDVSLFDVKRAVAIGPAVPDLPSEALDATHVEILLAALWLPP